MYRSIFKELAFWASQKSPMPILLRGARQVGKTTIVRLLAEQHFENFVELNFEFDASLKKCFKTLDPAAIIKRIGLLTEQQIVPGKTLLFFDELQDCPQAIMSLRYFYEMMPDLHVIGAGSLLEFALDREDLRMPVGRLQYLHMYPLSFKEFLSAKQRQQLVKFIDDYQLGDDIPEVVHYKALDLLKEYIAIGGMPAVVRAASEDLDWRVCQNLQTALLNTYQDDFSKYTRTSQFAYMHSLFVSAPGLVAEQFKYSKVNPDARSRDLKIALRSLEKAGLLSRVIATAASGLPLSANINDKKFKLLFLDCGLVSRATHLDLQTLLDDDLLLQNKGALAEQFVGQELLAASDPYARGQLYFWARDKAQSQAEVDYVINVGPKIIPIEVKSGSSRHLKSLRSLMHDKQLPIGIRLSQLPFSRDDSIISLPIYLASEIGRLLMSSRT